MRCADDHDLASVGFPRELRERFVSLFSTRSRTGAVRKLIIEMRELAKRSSPAAVPALERAEANVVTAIEEMRRELAVMMGDET